MIDEIAIVCDNPRHARGKVSKLATYRRNSGTWVLGRTADRQRRSDRKADRLRAAGVRPTVMDGIEADDFRPRCKLCGARAPDLTGAMLDVLAAHNKSRVSVSQLRGGSF
jgi:hypothetical protein